MSCRIISRSNTSLFLRSPSLPIHIWMVNSEKWWHYFLMIDTLRLTLTNRITNPKFWSHWLVIKAPALINNTGARHLNLWLRLWLSWIFIKYALKNYQGLSQLLGGIPTKRPISFWLRHCIKKLTHRSIIILPHIMYNDGGLLLPELLLIIFFFFTWAFIPDFLFLLFVGVSAAC